MWLTQLLQYFNQASASNSLQQKPTGKQKQGQISEQQAHQYLLEQGLDAVGRNFSYKSGEIDLIMADGQVLVFIEVRFRRSASYGGSAASVDYHKQQKLRHTAQYFLQQQFASRPPQCRFDVVAISANNSIEWIKNAF